MLFPKSKSYVLFNFTYIDVFMKYKVKENKSCYHGITKHKNGIFYLHVTNIKNVLLEFVDKVRLMFFF